ncbi:autotransporter outer membrane beta-barrel domain-containing protein [Aureibaculum sp. A20]|uniref:Autotransporter outer membrane beta-barrel domain-containing protein n=1 Tax=Aureibaculum flavum TaxID=2795986 RepID=A0ABS0WMM3_9FLAO|nr:outer membrane beta-barrel protein [Aureibaculum flavum]MBJ2173218.1 autotransporter outer membrane beta-barrel domain-containing protein [Aureibaculum flavum]
MNLLKKKISNTIYLGKRVMLAFTVALFGFSGYAQESAITSGARSQGEILISGGVLVHYTSNNVNDNKSNSFTTNITPKAGYFIMDNLAVGLELSVATSSSKSKSLFGDSKRNTTVLSLGAFGRYYLDNGLFFEGLVGAGTKKTSSGLEGIPELKLGDNTSTILGFRTGVGYAISLGDHVALEPTINYSWEKNLPKDAPSDYKDTLSSIFLGIGFTVFL